MKKIALLFVFLFLGFCRQGFTVEESFSQDVELLEKFKSNHIRLIVVTQPEGLNNLQGILSSSTSPGYSLTERGWRQLKNLKEDLAGEDIFKIFTSPLYRCMQAAEYLGEEFDLTQGHLIVDKRLKVQQFGDFEGFNYDAYRDLFVDERALLEADNQGMESGLSVFLRNKQFLWHIAKDTTNLTILVLTHPFNCCHISMCLTGEFGEIPKNGTFQIYDFQEDCSFSSI